MKIIEKQIGDLTPYPSNPRKNDAAVDAVASSIAKFGFKNPVIIDKNGVIICGHTRLKAAKKLGFKTVPCIMADDLSDEQLKAFRLADNKTAELAEWDFNILAEELENIDIDMSDFGFLEDEISDEDFGDDFSLSDGDKPEIVTMNFTLHQTQKDLIDFALDKFNDENGETFGNTNKNGNRLYWLVESWAKLSE